MLGSNQATRLPNRKQQSGGKIVKQTIPTCNLCRNSVRTVVVAFKFVDWLRICLIPCLGVMPSDGSQPYKTFNSMFTCASMFSLDTLAPRLPFHCKIELNSNLPFNSLLLQEKLIVHKTRNMEVRDINLKTNVLPG